MTDERKSEIGKLFLLPNKVSIEKLEKLEIQEIIFLIVSANYFKENKTFAKSNLSKKIELFLSVLNHKIRHSQELYIVYDKNTLYPFIDPTRNIWMFSKAEYSDNIKKYLEQQQIVVYVKRLSGEKVLKEFADMHRLGLKEILMDNGQYIAKINRDDILPPYDWKDTPKINIPIENPKLQNAMISFFQNLYSKNNYEGKDEIRHQLEDKIIEEILNAKYLVPIKIDGENSSVTDDETTIALKKDTIIHFGCLVNEDSTQYLSAFTDWVEFEKAFDKNVWKSNIASYKDLLTFSEKMQGVVINCRGTAFCISEENKKKIEEYRKEKKYQ